MLRRPSLLLAILVLPFWLSSLSSRAASTILTLPVQEDTWVSGLGSTTIRGAENRVGICPVAMYWIYLKFDLSDVSGAIEQAELRLHRTSGTRPDEIALYFIPDDTWSEGTLNGPNRPNPQNPPPGTSLAFGEENAGYDRWLSEPLTMAVALERQGDGTLTLMLREDPDEMFDVRYYRSRDAAVPDNEKPQLILTISPVINLQDTEIDPDTGAVTLHWTPTDPALVYSVEGRNQLGTGTWTLLSGASPLSETTWTDTNTAGVVERYYRVVGQDPPLPIESP